MEKYTYLNNANGAFVEELFQKYKEDPNSVDPKWALFFEGFEYGAGGPSEPIVAAVSNKEISVMKLIDGYRSRGHLLADTNPIRERRHHKADLALDYFGLSEADLETTFEVGNELGLGRVSLNKILDHLKATYCGPIGAEYMYCRDDKLRNFLEKEMESIANQPQFSTDQKKRILRKICEAVTFESFLQTKYIGKKRFSLEGVESLIPSLDMAIEEGAEKGAKEFVLGMAHRGRLNVLVNIFGKTYEDVFSEFEGTPLPEDIKGSGDVKYHLGRSSDIKTVGGKDVHLSLVPNPSHLEAVNPVVQGIVYSKCHDLYDGDYKKIIPILIHGDSAISGQGVNYELLNMSKIEGYAVGGTVHIVINNQVGFTANYKESRTSMYCTDLAKVTECPVFHVNGDDPLAVSHAMKLAIKTRELFNTDVFVDILGYRRYGHNEGDEPRFTQPNLYKKISKHPNVLKVLIAKLVESGDISQEFAQSFTTEIKGKLQEKLDFVKAVNHTLHVDYLGRFWKGLRRSKVSDFKTSVATKVSQKSLDKVANALVTVPESFSLFPKMKKILDQRKTNVFESKKVDWGTAELLAYGTLLSENHPIRISGQDSQRGTFSHRHAVIKDYTNEELYTPLNHIQEKQPKMNVFNSLLSEYCVLGFEYGYATARPQSLVIWEAQFGDFSNGAQIVIDQFISSSETKWQRMSGLVLYLPHGYEGQGPEHSSARPERYLQLCAEYNMYLVNPTTPANLFHMIRRQLKNQFRIPLIVFTPKSLLRHPKVVSDVSELTQGKFEEVYDDKTADPKKIKRLILCTGKIYYDLLERKESLNDESVALVRLEQIYPLPVDALKSVVSKYKKAKECVWIQEEQENGGFWGHMLRKEYTFGIQIDRVIARTNSSSPATGNEKTHIKQQKDLIDKAFKF
ncbi:2-oxoglutarate dehydrogenase E1 component [bacterium]|jgi:2-oxoglutarate dehydrogenase E1 component|nr:2-oxoglutarate dehydrogenase E1 component [bacterium]